MDEIQVNVRVTGGNGGFRGQPLNLRVAGLEDELFIPAVEREVQRSESNGVARVSLCGLVWNDPEFPERLHQIAPQGLTFANLLEYFGEEVDVWPPSINVDDGGYGGGADYIPYVIELTRTGFELAGMASSVLAAQRLLVRMRYSRFRQLAKDWNDTGVVSDELRRAVMAEALWRRTDFDKTFALGAARGPELLRSLEFEKIVDPYSGEVWVNAK